MAGVLSLHSLLLTSTFASAAEPPPARRGFQAAHHLGMSFPAGKATGEPGDRLGSRYKYQWQFLWVSLGAKITDEIFIGGYADIALGNKGSDVRVRSACRDDDANLENDIGCSASTLRVGLETRYSLFPDKLSNLWFGYGFGPVLASQSIDDRVSGRRETSQAAGWEYAKLSLGLTQRPFKGLGIGPYAMWSVGQFNSARTEINDETVFNGKIEDRALHFWGHLGLRLVLLP